MGFAFVAVFDFLRLDWNLPCSLGYPGLELLSLTASEVLASSTTLVLLVVFTFALSSSDNDPKV